MAALTMDMFQAHTGIITVLVIVVKLFSNNKIGFTFLASAQLGSLGQGLLNGCCCYLLNTYIFCAQIGCVCSHGVNYPDANGGISSPYGSDLNPFDHSFGGRPAMTSSQQDVRPAPPHGGPVGYVPADGAAGGGVRMPYPDERMSDRGSSIPNPLDERFSEAESSVIGYGGDPRTDRRYPGAPWRPNNNVGPLYDQGQLAAITVML